MNASLPWSELIGYLAAAMTTTAFLPQAVKALKTRDTQSLSLGMYLLFSSGVFFWLLYALLIGSMPILIANSITLMLALMILGVKVQNKLKGQE